jgi:feruloyl esterase
MTIECPKIAPCISHKAAVAARAAYDGPHDSKGKLLHPGFLPGSEIGWEGWVLPRSSMTINPNFGNEFYGVEAALASAGRQFLRPQEPVTASWHSFKADGLMARVMPLDKDMNAANPANLDSIGKYKARGGKIIVSQSLADEACSPTVLRNMMDDLAKRYGGPAEVNKFMRVFFAPGVTHVAPRGTAGSGIYDRMAVLEEWVMNGKAPDSLEVTGGAIQSRRTLHPYPAPPDAPDANSSLQAGSTR